MRLHINIKMFLSIIFLVTLLGCYDSIVKNSYISEIRKKSALAMNGINRYKEIYPEAKPVEYSDNNDLLNFFNLTLENKNKLISDTNFSYYFTYSKDKNILNSMQIDSSNIGKTKKMLKNEIGLLEPLLVFDLSSNGKLTIKIDKEETKAIYSKLSRRLNLAPLEKTYKYANIFLKAIEEEVEYQEEFFKHQLDESTTNKNKVTLSSTIMSLKSSKEKFSGDMKTEWTTIYNKRFKYILNGLPLQRDRVISLLNKAIGLNFLFGGIAKLRVHTDDHQFDNPYGVIDESDKDAMKSLLKVIKNEFSGENISKTELFEFFVRTPVKSFQSSIVKSIRSFLFRKKENNLPPKLPPDIEKALKLIAKKYNSVNEFKKTIIIADMLKLRFKKYDKITLELDKIIKDLKESEFCFNYFKGISYFVLLNKDNFFIDKFPQYFNKTFYTQEYINRKIKNKNFVSIGRTERENTFIMYSSYKKWNKLAKDALLSGYNYSNTSINIISIDRLNSIEHTGFKLTPEMKICSTNIKKIKRYLSLFDIDLSDDGRPFSKECVSMLTSVTEECWKDMINSYNSLWRPLNREYYRNRAVDLKQYNNTINHLNQSIDQLKMTTGIKSKSLQ